MTDDTCIRTPQAFLTSGLYSADYKSNNPIKSKGVIRGRAVLPAVGKGRGMSGRRRRGPAFPEPMHFGQTLLSQQRDFRLPFPLLVQVDEVRAKLDAKRKPPPYKQIRTNKYFHRPKLAGEVPVCHCDPDSDCGDNCMNRILQFVCDPRACPCGERCTNTSLGRRPSRKIDVAYVSDR